MSAAPAAEAGVLFPRRRLGNDGDGAASHQEFMDGTG